MANRTLEKDRNNFIERTCRIVMEVNIKVSEITPENVADYFAPGGPGESLSWEWAERQNRLLMALIKDEEAFEQFLLSVAKDDLAVLLNSDEIRSITDEEQDELLEKVWAGMSSEDALFFQEAKEGGILSDNIELVDRAFVTDWKHTELKDLCVIKGT